MKMEKLVVDIELFREEEPISVNRKYISKFTLPGLPYWEPLARLVQEPSPSLRAHGRGESMVSYFQKIQNIFVLIIFQECLPVHQDSFQLPLRGKV